MDVQIDLSQCMLSFFLNMAYQQRGIYKKKASNPHSRFKIVYTFYIAGVWTGVFTLWSRYTRKKMVETSRWIDTIWLRNCTYQGCTKLKSHGQTRIGQYVPWKDSRSRNVSKIEAAAVFCASVSFRRPNSSSLSLTCEAASAASFAILIRAYAWTTTPR